MGLYCFALLVGYTAVGWLFSAFGASGFVWLGTLAVILHLATAGTEAILLANAWVLGVVFAAVIQKIWPIFLGGYLPKKNASLWATIMILLWFFAILLIFALAFARQKLQKIGWNNGRAFFSLAVLTGGSLILGIIIFKLVFYRRFPGG